MNNTMWKLTVVDEAIANGRWLIRTYSYHHNSKDAAEEHLIRMRNVCSSSSMLQQILKATITELKEVN